MEINGNLVQLLEPVSGTGKNGDWKKQEFIIEVPGQFPKKVCITAWGDKIDLAAFAIGSPVSVGIDIESREYNGKWYTDVKAWKMNKAGDAAPQGSSATADAPSPAPAMEPENDPEGDLPF